MARKEVVVLLDDFDGKEYDSVETIEFGLDGKTFSIDLNEKNAKKLRETFAPYIDAGTKVTNGKRPKRTQVGPSAKTVRMWAQSQKEWKDKVPDRGRIPNEVLEAFNKAQGQG